jgi:hypothetical protein
MMQEASDVVQSIKLSKAEKEAIKAQKAAADSMIASSSQAIQSASGISSL